jgi:hypothetical protein
MTIRRGSIVACLVGVLGAGVAFAADTPEDAAQAAAESWLRLVDTGDYGASWERAAPALKSAIKQAEWSETAGSARAPLGRLGSRTLKSREYTEKAPTTRVIGGRAYSWGNGRYVILHYEAAFANKTSAAETVTAMADSDGAWRVAGYSIH